MKYFIILCLVGISYAAKTQPNITDSVHVHRKHCTNPPIIALDKQGSHFYGISNYDGGATQSDVLFYKLNSDYDTLWSKTFGGSDQDAFRRIDALPNGHLLVSGDSQSKDGDLSGVGNPLYGKELWFVELDTNGTIVRQEAYGGTWSSRILSISITPYGHIYIAGATNCFDGDFAHPMGPFEQDGFILKLNEQLQMQWVTFQSGASQEATTAISYQDDTRIYYIYGLATLEPEHVPQEAKGDYDIVVVQMDSSGTSQWKHRYGGSLGEASYSYILPDTAAQALYVVSATKSLDGDIQYRTDHTSDSINGVYNIWLLKLDMQGILTYSKAYGDTNGTLAPIGAHLKDGRIWVLSHTNGGGGDLGPDTDGIYSNLWVAIVDTQCNLRGGRVLGGAKSEVFSITKLIENRLIGIGYTLASNPNAFNSFACDTINKTPKFILEFGSAPLGIVEPEAEAELPLRLIPNPAHEQLQIVWEPELTYSLIVRNGAGASMYKASGKGKSHRLDISPWPSGTYSVELRSSNYRTSQLFIKQ